MTLPLKIYTIGFAHKRAEVFFEALRASGAKRVVDVRLYNTSQLAGFSKKDDLRYFLQHILEMDYVHLPVLAPMPEILDAYKNHQIDWASYERQFCELLKERGVEKRIDPAMMNGACLLCSEARPDHCHRRLVAEYLRQHWSAEIQIEHF